MAYIDGFVVAVPAANKDSYRRQAAEAAPLFQEFGAARFIEAWGDDVPEGEVTDFRRAVQAEADEVVVFSWIEYPSREARDTANATMMEDPRMKAMGETMPFDGKRMIYGGFAPLVETGAAGDLGYVDGSLVAVPADSRDAYRQYAERTAALIAEHGAMRVVEVWGDDVPDGKLTDFRRAVNATGDETVVFSWVEWPSRAIRDEAWQKLMADPRMQGAMETDLYDTRRRIYGGFAPLLVV